MSFVINRHKPVQMLGIVAVAMLALVGGCSNPSVPGSTSAIADFAVDFAREALAAWLL